ncbi:hypothetical protein BD289DRAFT_349991, partial [Coniella lustricola]
MGVQGLWQVISPSARPTNLATLNKKRLAVDASIWIYQFLKAVRDKEGNALRNSHVVGFFRRICKLLWFGIKPVFVFDGGAPALKRATLQGRRRRREGRREDAVRTAGKLLAVQMQRIAEEESIKRKEAAQQARQGGVTAGEADGGEILPDVENMVYAEEAFTAKSERQQERKKFFRQDQYHLPELETSIEQMGRPDDPRIMSVEELEEYARQFNSGEDVNLYDFSKIDFDGEFFKSLPAADRYNILNAARVRSRLRMGLSKEQLEVMFPNRMDFSRFQVERVQERNRLTQRLMYEMNMGGDLTIGGGGRIAGDRNREYILVKNDGVEGGYALGVLTQEKDIGEKHKPIDVDALQLRFATKDGVDEDEDWEDEADFEDVPIEGVNRLPKPKYRLTRPQDEDSLFVDNTEHDVNELFEGLKDETELLADEDEDVARAVEMSLKTQHRDTKDKDQEEEEEDFEDVPMPQWEQKAVDNVPKPITTTRGSMVAHIINNRANAAVAKKKEAESDSDSEGDFKAALAAARRKKKAQAPKPKSKPIAALAQPNVVNPFAGPLPFEKLNWNASTFEKKLQPKTEAEIFKEATDKVMETGGGFSIEIQDDQGQVEADVDMEGGFEKEAMENDAPRPLPPWLVHDDRDIREKVKEQQQAHNEINEEDERLAQEQEQLRRRRRQGEVVAIESSDDDDDDDVEIIDALPEKVISSLNTAKSGVAATKQASVSSPPDEVVAEPPVSAQDKMQLQETTLEAVGLSERDSIAPNAMASEEAGNESEEPEFEDVPTEAPATTDTREEDAARALEAEMDDALFAEGEYDEFSDPEDEQLLTQLAEEAEEHARFASELNHKSAQQNQEDYERELRQLRNQQKKDRRDADEVTQIMVTECQALLRLFGIPYITAPMEAEAQCAELVHLQLVDGIVTDDSDTFLFGGTRVYKNMFNSNKLVECYLAADLDKELSLSREQLISLAHLLGSDYTEGIPGIGPVTAIEILSEFPGREGLVHFKDWWTEVQSNPARPREADADSAFRRKFRKSHATKLFLPPSFPSPAVYEAYLEPEVDHNPEQFQWGVPDLDGLRRFLMATIGWSQERTDEVLVPVIRDMNRRDIEGTQSNITRFFDGSVGVGAKETFAPRQQAKGSRRMAAAVDKLRAKTGKGAAPPSKE